MRKHVISCCIWLMAFTPSLSVGAQPAQPDTVATGRITLVQALARVYRDNPELWKLRQERKIWDARILQAGLGSNPELTFVSEDFAGSAAFTDDRFSQFTLGLAQTWLLGNKLEYRHQLASLHQKQAYWDYRIQLQTLGFEVYQHYARLYNLAAEQKLLEELIVQAKEVHQLMSLKVEAGKLPPAALLQSELALKHLQQEIGAIKLRWQLEAQALSSLWGGISPDFTQLSGEWLQSELISLRALEKELQGHPRLARWQVEHEQRQLAWNVEQSQTVPDLNLSGGLRHHPPFDWGLVLSMGLTLPSANRNQGNIEKARLRQEMWATEKNLEERSLQAQLIQAYTLAQGEGQHLQLLREQVSLSQAQNQVALKAFASGKTGYLEVLISTQNLVLLRRQAIEVEGVYQQAMIQVLAYTQNLMPENLNTEKNNWGEKP